MRALLSVLSVIGLALPAAAQGLDERRISLNLQSVPFRQALQQAMAGSGFQYAIDPAVPDVPVQLKIREVPLRAGLRLLVRTAAELVPGLTYSRDGEIFTFVVRPTPEQDIEPVKDSRPDPRLNLPVTITLAETPLREALQKLFEPTRVQYSVLPNVPDVPVTLNLERRPAALAIRDALRVASVRLPGLYLVREGEVYVIALRHVAADPVAAGARLGLGVGKRVDLDLKEVPLPVALRELFQGSGINYLIEPNVPNVPITAVLRGVEFETALRLVIRTAATAVPHLDYRVEDGACVIGVRPAGAPAAAAPAPAERKVTLNLKDVPLRNALELLFAGTGIQYSVAPDVPNVPVNVELRQMPVTTALRLLVRQAASALPGLGFVRSGNTARVFIGPGEATRLE